MNPKLIQEIDKVANLLEDSGLKKEAEELDVISNTLEITAGLKNSDVVENNGKKYYHPLAPLQKVSGKFSNLRLKFVPSGIGGHELNMPEVEDSISLNILDALEIFVAGKSDFRLGALNRGPSTSEASLRTFKNVKEVEKFLKSFVG